jgi:predicted phosphoribosyltransferase
LTESKLGHPEHKWLAIGHLAEAEAESVQMFPEFANKIRNERLKLIEDNYDVYLIELIKKAGQLKEQEERDSEKS